ncbi:hypothetical protein B0J18DRAFT_486492 [Chaetomium sp. MPI-SDFR-AT-0129]|nr:hypothetical protein B0J18DRAFT_486492 [Chaetomium sp. MPI-SDFR-AT-0129]
MSANMQSSERSSPGLLDNRPSSDLGPLKEAETSTRDRRTRRVARNAESFRYNRNRSVARSIATRIRTRSLARAEAEQQKQQQQQQEEEQQQQQQQQEQADITANEAQNNTISPQINEAVPKWRPSIALGSPLWVEGEDPNAIQIADRKVAQTRLWVEHYQGVPYFAQAYREAVEARAQMDESAEENTQPRSTLKSIHNAAIQDRLDVLRSILQDAQFPPERENIKAAIAGYESGTIPYSDSYTLLWAGRIVDRCLDFHAFTHDRSTLLDRYAAEYGPGWLWYEPPLSSAANGGGSNSGNGSRAMRGGPTVIARKGFCLESTPSRRQGTENMGHYNIRMGFRRRKLNVARPTAILKQAILHGNGNGHNHNHTSSPTTTTTPQDNNHHNLRVITDPTTAPSTSSNPPSLPPAPPLSTHIPTIPQPDTSKPGCTIPDPDGPQIQFNMLLDSGATLPTLWAGDLPLLGIDPARYAAQSVRRVNTADSSLVSRVYEMDVRVFGGGEVERGEIGNGGNKGNNSSSNGHGSGRTPLPHQQQQKPQPTPPPRLTSVSSSSPPEKVKEAEPTTLICTIPVLVFPGDSKQPNETPDIAPDRLSGLLPFHICYLSGAAGSFKLWMGEERRDVLGAGRLPGHGRYGEILGDHNNIINNKINGRNNTNGGGTGRPFKRLPVATTIKLENWRSECLKTPDRVVFEHELDDGSAESGVLRDEDTVDGNIIMRAPQGGLGFDTPSRSMKPDGIQVVDLRGKRRRIQRDTTEFQANVVKKPQTKRKAGRGGRHGPSSLAN